MMALTRWIAGTLALLLVCSAPTRAQIALGSPAWSALSVAALRAEIAALSGEALPAPDASALDRAIASGEPGAVDAAANELALKVAHLILTGCSTRAERAGWSIPDGDEKLDLAPGLATALQNGALASYFAGLRPRHPDYAVLRSAYAAERDPAKRTQISRNLERWRWLPRDLGRDFILVNAASFEVQYWREGAQVGTWKVIVGKPSSPTPVFSATVTGVTLNPWWDIPAKIVRESVGALVRKNPALARERGYVWGGGRYRQRPGPNNALGRMKLVMPNSYSVYLHDTPNKALFDKEVRAFSHGCVRVGDALGFAATLLEGARNRDEVDQLLAGETVTVNLARPVPVYLAYFTATVRGDGQFALLPDIYGRDKRMGDAANPARPCAA